MCANYMNNFILIDNNNFYTINKSLKRGIHFVLFI